MCAELHCEPSGCLAITHVRLHTPKSAIVWLQNSTVNTTIDSPASQSIMYRTMYYVQNYVQNNVQNSTVNTTIDSPASQSRQENYTVDGKDLTGKPNFK